MRNLLLFLFIGTFSFSCNFILGIKTPRILTDKELDDFNKTIGIKDSTVYRLDANKFIEHFDSLKKAAPLQFKEIAQPMQIIVFDQDRRNIAHFINCNIGGVPLNWNRTGSFNDFPLMLKGILPPTYNLKYNEAMSYIVPTFKGVRNELDFGNYEYVYMIFYNRFVSKMTKTMFASIADHRKEFADNSVKFIYVFVDDLYVELDIK